jgi:hypothetical protein
MKQSFDESSCGSAGEALTPKRIRVGEMNLNVVEEGSGTPAHIVSHDYGAAVGWLLASLVPERVERFVVLSVGSRRASPTAAWRSGRSPGTGWKAQATGCSSTGRTK